MNPTHTTDPVLRSAGTPSISLSRKLAGETAQIARGLRAVLVLAGSVRKNTLEASVRRSRLELPVTQGERVLDRLRAVVAELQQTFDIPHLPLRLQLGPHDPWVRDTDDRCLPYTFVDRDTEHYRGTAGLLRDAVRHEPDDAYVLVILGCQVPLTSFPSVFERLAAGRGDVRLLTCPAHRTGGILLARCGTLRKIPRIGYVDWKEQALPRLAQEHDVRAIHVPEPSMCPVTDLPSYLEALRWAHPPNRFSTQAASSNSGFSVVETGADVHPSAFLHDTVVLKGARVELNAAVARSLVGPHGHVPAQSTVLERIISS